MIILKSLSQSITPKINQSMIFKKFIWILSGDDFNIIAKCIKPTRSRFTIIGGLVAVIFSLCFMSFYFAFTKLFQNYSIGILVGLFFGWMITNIYLLLLYTLSKNAFPNATNHSSRYFSIFVRLILIVFIALIVSKPIESIIFSKIINKEIKVFKKEKLLLYNQLTEKYYSDKIKVIKEISENENIKYNPNYINLIEEYKNQIILKEKQKIELISSMERVVNSSNYYVQGISILNIKYPICWFITAVIVLIFIFPAYLKIFIKEDTIFYKTKNYIENRLVKYEYELFKEKYNQQFKKHFNQDLHYSESHLDPPFNTIRKTDGRKILNENDLLDSIYNA